MAITEGIGEALRAVLRYEEVLGAVAMSHEGLVLGTAAVDAQDAEWVGALGASLVGAADRTARRLGAGTARDVYVGTSEGMIHLRCGGEFAVMVFSERCDATALGAVCDEALREIGTVLGAG